MTARFVADVGGTNIRIAREVDGQLFDIEKYLCKDFEHIADVFDVYFSAYSQYQFTAGCIAIACPITSDEVKMTNHTWSFSIEQTKSRLGLQQLAVINDYTAISMSLPVLDDTQKVQIGGEKAQERAPIAVVGPGTGLGVGHLVPVTEGWCAMPGEGGHVSFAPNDETDMLIWQFLRSKYDHVSAEQVLSGLGIVQIYQAIASHQSQPIVYTTPAEVTGHALDGSCAVCLAALEQFCRILGSIAGNLALTMGTFGGVYIAGGIAQRFVDFIVNSDLRKRFEDKGRFKTFLQPIPVYLITEPDHGLLGAAAYLEQLLRNINE